MKNAKISQNGNRPATIRAGLQLRDLLTSLSNKAETPVDRAKLESQINTLDNWLRAQNPKDVERERAFLDEFLPDWFNIKGDDNGKTKRSGDKG